MAAFRRYVGIDYSGAQKLDEKHRFLALMSILSPTWARISRNSHHIFPTSEPACRPASMTFPPVTCACRRRIAALGFIAQMPRVAALIELADK